MATVLKTVIPFYGIVSSNLTPSATDSYKEPSFMIVMVR